MFKTPLTRRQRQGAATLLLAPALLLASCTASAHGTDLKNADGTVNVRYEGAANTVTLIELAAGLGYLDGIKLEWVGNNSSGPLSIQNTATGETDIGGAFAGAVVKLQEAGSPVTAVASYYGSNDDYFVGFYAAKDGGIKEARDLIGKTVAVNTLGAHSEAVIHTYLKAQGLSPDEIDQVQLVVLPPTDTEQAVRTHQVDVGALSGAAQVHAVKQGDLREVFRDTEVFDNFNGGEYVLRDDFIAEYPEAAHALATGTAKAANWASSHSREEVLRKLTDIIESRDRGEDVEALQYFNGYGVGKNAPISDEDFSRWSEWLKSTGIVDGEITPSEYYTNEFNDLASEG
ncbi:ABC transporter substrate-binding protein [Arthrobacter sp. S41]|uniref:ABC transporter substrate-binding protein n=1 Tax=Arthrobacter sp. S41 TaxID=2509721 RepID=UPI00103600BD|nr:ABC transporter substrate-binding protein [Arthrobacter sp. S41]TAP25664.1 ABC transporter substrate-binding protein [Arthrobacter sp. S41]